MIFKWNILPGFVPPPQHGHRDRDHRLVGLFRLPGWNPHGILHRLQKTLRSQERIRRRPKTLLYPRTLQRRVQRGDGVPGSKDGQDVSCPLERSRSHAHRGRDHCHSRLCCRGFRVQVVSHPQFKGVQSRPAAVAGNVKKLFKSRGGGNVNDSKCQMLQNLPTFRPESPLKPFFCKSALNVDTNWELFL